MSRPKLLDLFCCAGGAAKGYAVAGFDVVGVDIAPQPNYPYEFHQADALEFLARRGGEFDAIHASPPCQGYLNLGAVNRALGRDYDHPDLIGATRELLIVSGSPWVIENVQDADRQRDDRVRAAGLHRVHRCAAHRAPERGGRRMTAKAPCPACGKPVGTTKTGLRRHYIAEGTVCPAVPPTSILIPLPWTTAPISLNDRGVSPYIKARKVSNTLAEARWAVRSAKVRPIVGAEITLHFRVPDNRRRDADNLAGVLKVCQDALVKEGVLPDDSWVHVPAATQRIHPPQRKVPAAMWLELRVLTEYQEGVA